MKDSKKNFLYPILFTLIVAAVTTCLLASINHLTSDAIALNEQTVLRKTILYVFNIDYPDDPEKIEEIFNQRVKTKQVGDETIYYIEEGDKITAYAFPIDGVALWGSVHGYVAISSDYSEILGIDFLSHSETPGLGGRISEDWFKEQFRGLKLDDSTEEYIIYRPAPGGNVDAISGATQTSNAIRDLLNNSIHEFITEQRGQ